MFQRAVCRQQGPRSRGLAPGLFALLPAGLLTILAAMPVRGESPSLRVGEVVEYKIKWGVLPVGRMTITTEAVPGGDAPLVRVRAKAESSGVASLVYGVDNRMESVIRPRSGLPVRFSKTTREGEVDARSELAFDHEKGIARWTDSHRDEPVEYSIQTNTCDALSLLQELRRTPFRPGEQREYRVAFDDALRTIVVEAHEREPVRLPGGGTPSCIRLTVHTEDDGIFVRKTPRDIWVTEDDRRVIARMNMDIPVGTVRVMLDTYRMPSGSGGELEAAAGVSVEQDG